MKKLLKKIIIAFSGIISVILALLILDITSDRRHEIEIIKSITLLEKAPQTYPKNNRTSGTIHAGEKVKVLRMDYGKDFRALKVRGSIGQEGWFVEELDNAKVKN